MKPVLTILKKDLTLGYPWIANLGGIRKDKKIRGQFIGQLCLLIFLVIPIFVLAYLLRDYVTLSLKSEFAEILLGAAQLIALLFTLIFSVTLIFSTLYFSNDFKIMLRLPFSEKTALTGQILSLSFSSLIPSLILPIFFSIWHGVITGKDALFYFNAVFGSVALVVFVISLVTLIIVWLMKYINRIPHLRNLLQIIGLILVLVISIGPNLLSQRIARNMRTAEFDVSAEFTMYIHEIADALFDRIPTLRLWLNALFAETTPERIGCGIALLGLGIAMMLIAVHLGARPLAEGVRTAETVATNKKAAKGVRARGWNRKSKALAVALREAGEIFRTPVYIFNIAGSGILLPLILGISLMSSGLEDLSSEPELRFFMNFILTLYAQPKIRFTAWLIFGSLIGLFMGSSGQSGTTSITREGKRVWLMKSLPISAKDQVNGRMLCSMFFGLLATLPSLGVFAYFLRATVLDILFGLIAILIMITFSSSLGLRIDIQAPNFAWQNPQHAIKRSANIMFLTLGTIVYLGLLIFAGVKLYKTGTLTLLHLPYAIGSILLLHAVAALLLYRSAKSALARRMIGYDAG